MKFESLSSPKFKKLSKPAMSTVTGGMFNIETKAGALRDGSTYTCDHKNYDDKGYYLNTSYTDLKAPN